MYSYYNPDVSFAVSEICLKPAVLDHGSNRSSGWRFNLDLHILRDAKLSVDKRSLSANQKRMRISC